MIFLSVEFLEFPVRGSRGPRDDFFFLFMIEGLMNMRVRFSEQASDGVLNVL